MNHERAGVSEGIPPSRMARTEVTMDVKAYLVKLKEDSGDRVSEWAGSINRRRDEALATLCAEGMEVESWFLLSLNGEDYLFSYMRTEDMQRAKRVAKESIHDIDAYHQQFKRDTWVRGSVTELQLLVDLSLEKDGG